MHVKLETGLNLDQIISKAAGVSKWIFSFSDGPEGVQAGNCSSQGWPQVLHWPWQLQKREHVQHAAQVLHPELRNLRTAPQLGACIAR